MSQEQDEIDRLRARVAELEASVQQQRAIAIEEAARGILRARAERVALPTGFEDLVSANDPGQVLIGNIWHDPEDVRVAARSLGMVDAPTPDVVPVPREELAVLRDGFGLLRTAWNLSLCDERIGSQAGALIEQHDALRSGEAGKNTTTNGAENG